MSLHVTTPKPGPYPSSGRHARPALSQQVYLTLRHMLMVGGFKPGESVSLRSLARRLGTSAMPVREAVNRLIAENALRMLPNRNVIVPHMSRERFAEITRLRQLLESMTAEEACRRMDAEKADELDILCQRGLDALARDDIEEILTTNKDFHFCLYEASESDVIVPIIEGLWMQMGPFMRLSLAAGRQRWDGSQHLAIRDAIGRRDPAAISRAVKRDIKQAAAVLFEINAFDAPAAGMLPQLEN